MVPRWPWRHVCWTTTPPALAPCARLRAASNLNQPGDPVRLAQAVMKLVASRTPPLRLPLGTDTLQTIADTHAFVAQETAQWRAVAASTDFPVQEREEVQALSAG